MSAISISEFLPTPEAITYPTPAKEILGFCSKNGVPLSLEMTGLLTGEKLPSARYGTEYTLASGNLIRTITREERDINRREVFGLSNLYGLEEQITEEVRKESGLKPQEVLDLTNLEVTEVLRNPTGRYPGINILTTTDCHFQASKIFLSLASQAIYPEHLTGLTFERSTLNRCELCKDSEYYLSARLDPTLAYSYDASSTIFHQNGEPVFFQKTGRYKTGYSAENGRVFTNATAINLKPVEVNGIVLPQGTLFGLNTDIDSPTDQENQRSYVLNRGNQSFEINRVISVMPLRLTMFAIPPEEQEVTFGFHFTDVVETLDSWTHQTTKKLPTLQEFQTKAERILEQ